MDELPPDFSGPESSSQQLSLLSEYFALENFQSLLMNGWLQLSFAVFFGLVIIVVVWRWRSGRAAHQRRPRPPTSANRERAAPAPHSLPGPKGSPSPLKDEGSSYIQPFTPREAPVDPYLMALLSKADSLSFYPALMQDPLKLCQVYRVLDSLVPQEKRSPGSSCEGSSENSVSSPSGAMKQDSAPEPSKPTSDTPPTLTDLIQVNIPDGIARRLMVILLSTPNAPPATLKRPTLVPKQELLESTSESASDFVTPPRSRNSASSPSAVSHTASPSVMSLSRSVVKLTSTPQLAQVPSAAHTSEQLANTSTPLLNGHLLMSGWLHKKAGSTLHIGSRWQKRYFCLLGCWLVYYKTETQAVDTPVQVQGAYDLSQMVAMGLTEDSDLDVNQHGALPIIVLSF